MTETILTDIYSLRELIILTVGRAKRKPTSCGRRGGTKHKQYARGASVSRVCRWSVVEVEANGDVTLHG